MTPNISIKKAISTIKSELKEYYPVNEIDSFVFLIFEEVLDYNRTKLLMSQDEHISANIYKNILNIVTELKSYKPIQYILGTTAFYNLTFKLTPDVLIPRPETEELVDWIISENNIGAIKILDIGAGSGCIAISLSKNMPGAIVHAVDISNTALNITKQNSKLNDANILINQLDILNPNIIYEEKFDVIVSNPPYIRELEKELMHKNVLDFEPYLALFVPDSDPLQFYRAIVSFSVKHLNSNGRIYFEINEAFGKETTQLLEKSGFKDILLKKDINGKDRMLRGTLN